MNIQQFIIGTAGAVVVSLAILPQIVGKTYPPYSQTLTSPSGRPEKTLEEALEEKKQVDEKAEAFYQHNQLHNKLHNQKREQTSWHQTKKVQPNHNHGQ